MFCSKAVSHSYLFRSISVEQQPVSDPSMEVSDESLYSSFMRVNPTMRPKQNRIADHSQEGAVDPVSQYVGITQEDICVVFVATEIAVRIP